MKSVLAVLFFAAVCLGLLAWDARPGNHVPDWLYMVAALPMAMVRIFSTRYGDGSDGMKGLGLAFLFLSSIGAMLLGAIGSSMRGTWGELLSAMLPIGAVGFVISLIAGWLYFKD